MKYKCYICGNPLDGTNCSEEHIIPQSIGGRLISKNLLCKDCNSKLGATSDSVLANNLEYLTFMLDVKKDRNNKEKIKLKEIGGKEIEISKNGKVQLSHAIIQKETGPKGIEMHNCFRNMEESEEYLNILRKRGKLNEDEVEKIKNQAVVEKCQPVCELNIVIGEAAFPSIVRSAVNYYIDQTHKIEEVEHLIPYIKGEKKCKEVLRLIVSDKLPYTVNDNKITHMIHIEGSATSGILYALVEYFEIYTYIVLLNGDYKGPNINETYCYDVINSSIVERNFSLPLDKECLANIFQAKFELPKEKKDIFIERIGRAMKIVTEKLRKKRD